MNECYHLTCHALSRIQERGIDPVSVATALDSPPEHVVNTFRHVHRCGAVRVVVDPHRRRIITVYRVRPRTRKHGGR